MNNYINQNQMVSGGAQFNPYMNTWPQARLPVYTAAPIHGANAAWQFPMGPNSEIYLPDADQDIIWWIRTDATGNKQVQGFDIKLHEEPAAIDTASIESRLAAIEEWINAKSNKSNAKRNAATVGTTVAD